jgi:hypothetical protein
LQLNPGRRTWRSRAAVTISAVIVAATGALVITSCSTTQHPATLPQVSCGSAWTHFVNSATQLFGADHGALTCFNTAARECRPASIHVTEMGVDTGTDFTFTIKSGGSSCQVTEQSQYYSANGGGSHGPVVITACHRTAVTSRGVSLTCGGQAVLIPAKVTPI